MDRFNWSENKMFFKLATQTADMNINGICRTGYIPVPNFLEKPCSCENFPAIPQKIFQKGVFFVSQAYNRIPNHNSSGTRIYPHITI